MADRDRAWGIFATTVGESRFGPGSTYPPVGHPPGYFFQSAVGRRLHEFQIIYISAGRGWFRSGESSRVPVEAGQVIFLFPGIWHSYAPFSETGWNEHWVGFNGDLAHRMIRHGFFTADQAVLKAGEEDRLLILFRDLVEIVRSNPPALQQILAGAVMRILGLLYSVQQSKLSGQDPGMQIIHRAIMRMRTAEEDLNMPALARELCVTYRWFRRAFVQHTGLSPHQYFLDFRLARARDLLAHTDLSIKEVASKAGFKNLQYFSRLFHKKVALTPGEWRAQAQEGRPG